MTEITLVLPFALPPPEMAPDLVRALQTPALAALLSRPSVDALIPFRHATRALPHELWLAHALGLSAAPDEPAARPAFAAAAMRAFGLEPADGSWFIVNPVHIEVTRKHLLMNDQRRLALTSGESRALFDAARPYFDEIGKTLLFGDAHTWFMRADDWAELETASPDAATGRDLSDFLPAGPNALACRKLQNEIQMLWFTHPVNAEREARGLSTVNSFWFWGAANAAAAAQVPMVPLAATGAPPWLRALAAEGNATLPELLAQPQRASVLVCAGLIGPALAADWSCWLAQMHKLEQQWFAPLQAALGAGRVARLRLILSHRDARLETTTTPMAQRKFWRRPTLNRLLP